jgi:hypothetical protein
VSSGTADNLVVVGGNLPLIIINAPMSNFSIIFSCSSKKIYFF